MGARGELSFGSLGMCRSGGVKASEDVPRRDAAAENFPRERQPTEPSLAAFGGVDLKWKLKPASLGDWGASGLGQGDAAAAR